LIFRLKSSREGTFSLKALQTNTTYTLFSNLFLGLLDLARTRHSIHYTHTNHYTMPSVLSATLALAALALQASAGLLSPNPTSDRNLFRRDLNTGMGTRYGLNCKEEDCWQQGACAFTDYTLPSTVDGSTCVSEDIWNSSEHCGGCISVAYKGKKIVVMVSTLDPIKRMDID
jgi:hypothetical protein